MPVRFEKAEGGSQMLKRTTIALTGTLAVGAVLLPSRPLSAQTDVEIIYSGEYGTTVRFRNDDGVLVERRSTGSGVGVIPYTTDAFLDEDGDVERKVVRYRDGRSLTEHFAYGRPGPDGSKRFFARARNIGREEMDEYLSRLPSPPATSRKAELALFRGRPLPAGESPLNSGHPWGHHWHEKVGDSTRTTFRLLHQEIEVEPVRLDENSWRISDSHGGMRHESFTKTSLIERGCDHCLPYEAVAAYDASGRIVHVVTSAEGYPTETWYGETLVARYHYAQIEGARPQSPSGSLGDFWVELIDARTGRRLLDSRVLPITSSRPVFSALGTSPWMGMIQSVGDELFAVVIVMEPPIRRGLYALLPLGEGPVWRTILAAGTEVTELQSLVHYTDNRLRIEFQFDHTNLVVEAPRRGASPIKVTWPEYIALPYRAGEEVGALSAPRQPRPFPLDDGRVPPPKP